MTISYPSVANLLKAFFTEAGPFKPELYFILPNRVLAMVFF